MNTENIEQPERDTLPPPPAFQDGFEAAYERRLAEIKAVPEEALVSLNLDVHAAVATVLGALPEIIALRGELAKIPQLNVALVDRLEDFAQAAGEAHGRFVMAMTPDEDIVALNEEGSKIRDVIHTDAVALVKRGLLDAGVLSKFKGLVGYKNVGFDLIDWAIAMRDSWNKIQGKTGLTFEEIQKARQLGERLVRAAGLREQGPTVAAEVTRIRHQAVSLLVNAYEEVRRGITFLRWREDDVDTIAPSLYASKGSAKKSDEGNTPGAGGNVSPQPGSGTATQPVATPSNGQPVAQVATSAVGLPGDKPFALV